MSSLVASVAPNRQPGAYARTSGAPVNVPSGLIPFPGATSAVPNVSGNATIQKDTPGRRSNATIQVARVVPMTMFDKKIMTKQVEDLANPGRLAWSIPYAPPGGKAMMGLGSSLISGLHSRDGFNLSEVISRYSSISAPGKAYGEKVTNLTSHNYVVEKIKPTFDTLPLNESYITAYVNTYGYQERQRITHVINISMHDSSVADTDQKFARSGFDAAYNDPDASNLFTRYLKRLYVDSTVCMQPAKNAAQAAFELDPQQSLHSPFLLPKSFMDNSKFQYFATNECWPPLGTRGFCNEAAVMEAMENASMMSGHVSRNRTAGRSVMSDFNEDVRVLIYDAFYNNTKGLLGPMGLGPWRPDGFVILKMLHTLNSRELEQALETENNQLYNIAISGPAIVTQFTESIPSGLSYQDASAMLAEAKRLQTLPGDNIYVLCIGQLKRNGQLVGRKESSGQGAKALPAQANHRFCNIRLHLSTSEELNRCSMPKGWFGPLTNHTDTDDIVPVYVSQYEGMDETTKDFKHGDIATFDGKRVVAWLLANNFLSNSGTNISMTKSGITVSRDQGREIANHVISAYGTPSIVLNYRATSPEDSFRIRISIDPRYIDTSTSPISLKDAASVLEINKELTQKHNDPVYKSERMGLMDDEYILGAYQLGTVVDSHATLSSTPRVPTPLVQASSAGLNVKVDIKWRNALYMHQAYWSRGIPSHFHGK
jgi:hypothetical protein